MFENSELTDYFKWSKKKFSRVVMGDKIGKVCYSQFIQVLKCNAMRVIILKGLENN